MPYELGSELFADLFGHQLSQATLVNANRTAYEILEPVEKEIKRQVVDSPVVHFDETGMGVNGKWEWLHVASTEILTCYAVHPKRGHEATEAMGILPDFQGIAVHDFWKPYFKYDCRHVLCNAHHLRELTGVLEQDKQKWPKNMIAQLLEIKKAVDEKRRATSDKLDPVYIQGFGERYDQVIENGMAENPPPISRGQPGRRGRKNSLSVIDTIQAAFKGESFYSGMQGPLTMFYFIGMIRQTE